MKILASAFLPKRPSRKISTNRFSYASKDLFTSLSIFDAVARSNRSGNDIKFYGFAFLEAKNLYSIRLDDGKNLDVRGTPSIRNPLHADIELPEYEGKDYDMLIADQLIELSKYEAV